MDKIEKVWIHPDSFSEKGESDLLPRIEKLSRDAIVFVFINSSGGDLYACFSIMDALKMFCKKTIGIVMGRCHSAAIDLFLSLDRRFCTPNSSLMIHESSLSFGEGYEFTSKLNEEIKMQQKIESERIKIVTKKTLIDKDTIKLYIDRKEDMYFSATEALHWGLVEGIVKTERELYSKARSRMKK